MLADMNLSCESCHFDINELRKDLPGRIAWANDLGLKQTIVPSLDPVHRISLPRNFPRSRFGYG